MKEYIKNGKRCFLCHCRKKLIQKTPEEIVRQNFILKLINEFNIPKKFIEVEVPLSYYEKGKMGRADIIVSEFDSDNNEIIPLIVIECKAPNIELTDKVFEQTVRYDEFLKPLIMVMTNGIETIHYSWNNETNDYEEIITIPQYEDLIKGIGIKFLKEKIDNTKRLNHNDSVEKNRKLLLENHNIGKDTHTKLIPLITNLYGLINDEKSILEKLFLKTKDFISDGGIRYTTFGNSAGGGWTGDYRYFILENEIKETEIVSFSIMGKYSEKNTGFTQLNIAIDNFEKSHLSLQYSIDRFVKNNNDIYEFWHDGTLTIGNKGRAKNKDVREFIKINAPYLIKENSIYLGSIDNSQSLTWDNPKLKELISNLIEYSFLRDKFRKQFKKNE